MYYDYSVCQRFKLNKGEKIFSWLVKLEYVTGEGCRILEALKMEQYCHMVFICILI